MPKGAQAEIRNARLSLFCLRPGCAISMLSTLIADPSSPLCLGYLYHHSRPEIMTDGWRTLLGRGGRRKKALALSPIVLCCDACWFPVFVVSGISNCLCHAEPVDRNVRRSMPMWHVHVVWLINLECLAGEATRNLWRAVPRLRKLPAALRVRKRRF